MKNRSITERNKICDEILEKRLEEVIPVIMKDNDVDMWVISSEEYNDDPIVKTFLPSNFYNTRREMIFVFYKEGNEYKSGLICHPNLQIDLYETIYYVPTGASVEVIQNKYKELKTEVDYSVQNESIFAALARFVNQKKPKNISLNITKDCAFANGLVYSHYEQMKELFLTDYQVKESEQLAIDWLSIRTDFEMPYYKEIIQDTRQFVKNMYSSDFIKPGKTTIKDCVRYLQTQALDAYMVPWFEPTVMVKRKEFINNTDFDTVIMPGDILHCDYGFEVIKLNSDIQEIAYVLKEGETKEPDNITDIQNRTNRVKEIIMSEIAINKTGNEVLKNSLKRCAEEKLGNVIIYCHSIGYHGHAAGPSFGRTDCQKDLFPTGKYVVKANTCYSIEFNIDDVIKGFSDLPAVYGQELEVFFDGTKTTYMADTQTKVHLI